MRERKKEDADSSLIKRLLAAEEESAEPVVVPFIRERNSAGASTAPDVMKHMATGAGSATLRSGKGGKSGGGMGGQQAGGIKAAANVILTLAGSSLDVACESPLASSPRERTFVGSVLGV